MLDLPEDPMEKRKDAGKDAGKTRRKRSWKTKLEKRSVSPAMQKKTSSNDSSLTLRLVPPLVPICFRI
jgi:hypothetical protein